MIRIEHLNLHSYLITSVIDYLQRKICPTIEVFYVLYHYDTVST